MLVSVFLKVTKWIIDLSVRCMKGIIGKLHFIKMKNFCSAKDDVKRIRKQSTDWEKIFAKGTFDKVLLSKICKELLKLSSKKTKTSFLKVGQRP